MIERDEHGVAHIVALSGGHDSTALSLLLKEREPRPYNYICTPTGDELPEMFEFWKFLGSDNVLGKRIIPVMNGTLKSVIASQGGALPNFRQRWCTRILKIEPYRDFLLTQAAIGPVVSYVGLRADETGRAGGAFSDIEGVTMRFPLREWGMGDPDVHDALRERGIDCPVRTDCARCYHQKIGEWFLLWAVHPEIFEDAVQDELKSGNTYRTPGRDSWPTKLIDMRAKFEEGKIPNRSLDNIVRELQQSGSCRVCTL